jgi:iron(III) transport system ATP-binding protein
MDVIPGELLVITGPSGCGKTTLLRLIAGLEAPEQGLIKIWGQPVAGPTTWLPPEARRVGLVFQEYALFPHMTVAENLAFGLRGWSRKSRALRVSTVLDMVRLLHLAMRYPHELSGGEQQRVALARALAPGPDLLLLDEPFSNLDAGLRRQLREEVKGLLKASGNTAIFVTHDQEEALFMGDRMAIMNEGRLEQVGTLEEIYHRPATRFVARFMGLADFIPANVQAGALRTEAGWLQQPDGLTEGSSAEVMVRPDDVSCRPSERGQGRILARFFQGAFYLYRVLLPSGGVVHCLQSHTQEFPVGTQVEVRLDPGHALRCFVNGRALASPPVEPLIDHVGVS